MRKIAVLDQQTIDKIAAGEVVERPSSIVKELVENAIDAGATAVTVEITDGGKKMIRITDNGRVYGKMAHSERIGDSVAINIYGEQDLKLFESGVKYFK